MIDLIDVNEDVICLINLVKSIKNIFEYDSSILVQVESKGGYQKLSSL